MDSEKQRLTTTIRASFILSIIHWSCFALHITLLPYITKDLNIDNVHFGYLNTAMAVCQLLTSPKYSRWAGANLKFAITVAFLSSCLSNVLTAMSHGFLLLMFSSVASAFAHAHVAMQTAIALSTDAKERTAMFGKLGATIGVGFIVGSGVGGASAGVLGLRIPFWLAAVACAMAAFLGPSFITVSAEKKGSASEEHGEHGLKTYGRLLAVHQVSVILFTKTVSLLPFIVMTTIFGVYLVDEFQIGPGANAFMSVFVGLCMTAMNAGGVAFLKKFLDDRQLLYMGLAAFGVTAIGLAMALSYYMFFAVFTFMAIGMALVGASTDSMLTKSVPSSDHAAVLGLVWAVDALTRVVAPTMAGYMLTKYGFASFGYAGLVGNAIAAVLVFLLVSDKITDKGD